MRVQKEQYQFLKTFMRKSNHYYRRCQIVFTDIESEPSSNNFHKPHTVRHTEDEP